MGATATFDLTAFRLRYPEFATVAPSLAQAYFAEATLYLRNDGTGPVQDAGQQLVLLNMVVAHLAAINQIAPDGSAASTLVGRISSATEGSVGVSTDLGDVPGSAAWFAQTKYGFSFWQAMAGYRSARYIPGAGRGCSPWRRGWV